MSAWFDDIIPTCYYFFLLCGSLSCSVCDSLDSELQLLTQPALPSWCLLGVCKPWVDGISFLLLSQLSQSGHPCWMLLSAQYDDVLPSFCCPLLLLVIYYFIFSCCVFHGLTHSNWKNSFCRLFSGLYRTTLPKQASGCRERELLRPTVYTRNFYFREVLNFDLLSTLETSILGMF